MTDTRFEHYQNIRLDIPWWDEQEYEDHVITAVTPYPDRTGWEVSMGSWCCGVPDFGIGFAVPRVGRTLRIYGGFGFQIQGQAIDGQVLWYRDEDQRAAERERWLAQYARENRERAVRSRAYWDRQYSELHPALQRRVDRFRAEDADKPEDETFAVRAEGYELCILHAASKLHEHFVAKARAEIGDDELGMLVHVPRLIRQWKDAGYEAQVAEVSFWEDYGHSGNTHSAATAFAIALAEGHEDF